MYARGAWMLCAEAVFENERGQCAPAVPERVAVHMSKRRTPGPVVKEWPRAPPARGVAIATMAFNAPWDHVEQLSFARGDMLMLHGMPKGGLWFATSARGAGYAPVACIELKFPFAYEPQFANEPSREPPPTQHLPVPPQLPGDDALQFLEDMQSDDLGTMITAARGLKSLVFKASAGYKDGLVDAGIATILTQLLSNSSPFAVEEASSCMYSISMNHSASKEALLDAGALPLLVELLGHHSLPCRRNACATLYAIAMDSRKACVEIASSSVEQLLPWLRALVECTSAQELARLPEDLFKGVNEQEVHAKMAEMVKQTQLFSVRIRGS